MFTAHELMGALYLMSAVQKEASWIVWAGVGMIGAHVVLSTPTTRQMLHDEERPPNKRKKEHQLKKWVTGIVFVVMLAAHVLAPFDGAVWILASMILAIAVCTHICVSAKSLSVDVSAPRSSIAIVRAIAITPTFVVIAALLF